MANIAIFRINYKSDFILTLNSDAGWLTPFCIKFWTGAPSQAYFASFDGTTYTHCAPVEGEPTKLVVQFDDHHLPIGDLKFQIGYHFTVADFPTSVEDEVLNQDSVIIEVDGEPAQVMLDFNGETAPEIEFSLPVYANEAQRIANEEQRIAAEEVRIQNEETRISAEQVRQQNETQRISREQARQTNETQRIEREQARQTNETQRIEREQARQTNETQRIEREQTRQTNETQRIEREQIRQEHEAQRIANETERVTEFAEIKTEAVAATNAANAAASLANEKAEYAQTQGNYAKAQGDTALADHERAEADHTRAESDHTTAANDHTQATSDHTQATSDHTRAEADHSTASADHTTATSDHTQAGQDHTTAAADHTQAEQDHTRAESDHTRAESDHTAVEVYVDSLGAFDISAYHATGGVLAKYADLTAALGTGGANIPDDLRKGGMSVKFVQSSDNKYVQARCMAEEFTTDTTQWAIADEGVYVENPEFVYVKTDAEGKILWAIRTNGDIFYGAGVPSQVVNYINKKIEELSLDEYEDIVAFLNGLEEGDKTLQQLFNEKLDAEGLDAEALSMQSNINSQEYLQLTTDSEDKILEGIRANGTKVVELPMEIQGVRYETLKHPEFIKAILDAKGYVVLAIRKNGSIFAPGLNAATHDYQEEITELQNDVSDIQESVSEIQEEIANIEDNSYEIADGNLTANGSYSSELEASCIFNSENDAYVKYHKASKRGKRDYSNLNIIAVNHDDLAKSDYVGTRKIYNKYGFNANYNLILKPFATKADQEERVVNIKKLIADGNDLGLHAILGKSYWWLNKLFDIRPDSTFTFAPTLANIQGSEADHTGVNDFGDTITAVTKVSEIGFVDLPTTALRELVVADMTAQDMIDVIRCYSIYGDSQYLITGLDLNGNTATKTTLQWLEYWYNNLIDDTLGYSSTETSIANKFAEDYSGTYPTKSEIKSGVISSNGVFTKGFFKGCKTCCNYEVTDRCIDVALAFIEHYLGVSKFTNFGRHGIGFFTRTWINQESGISYDDADETILSNEAYKLYNTRKSCWESQFDVLLSKGIKMCSHTNPLIAVLEGQVGLYFGQKDVRPDFFAHASNQSGAIDYWNFFGTNKSGFPLVSYSDFETFLANENNWLKFAYENAGNSVTRNGKTFTVFECIYHAINVIRACKDTGIVPLFSVDTIINSPTIEATVELICRYCYANNIRIVPVEEARVLVSSRRKKVSGNLFPNAGFNQGLYDFFNRDTTSLMAKIPDSWDVSGPSKLSSVSVDTETIDGKDTRVLTVECVEHEQTNVYTKIYGLQAGNYKLSLWAKSENANGTINVYKKYNKDYINIGFNGVQRFTPIETKRPGNTWVKYEVDFAIEYPHKNPYDGTDFENVICQGYEDNVSNVVLELHVQSDMSIAMPELVII